MANSSVIGLLRVLLTANTAEYESAMKSSASTATKWTKDLKSIGKSATDVGSTLTKAFTVPIAGLGLAVSKLAIDFESSFAGVRKTVDATEPEFQAMAASFRSLSKEIPINVNELNRLGEAAGALGIPKAAIVDFSRVMAELGVTTNVTSDEAAASIGKIQTVFQAAGKDTDRFASTLVDLGNKGASTEHEILELANRIASAGQAVGLSQAQVLGFSSAIANVGIEAEAGGTAISKVFSDLSIAVSHGGDDLAGFAKVAGTSVDEFARKFKTDAAGAVTDFVTGLGRMKKEGGDLNLILEDLGFKEVRQARALRDLALSGDNLSKSLKTANTAWRENTALTEEARKRFETTEARLTLLWNRIKDIGITLGNALKPAIDSAITGLDHLLPVIETLAKGFAALPGPVQALAIGFAAAVAAAGPVIYIFGQIAMSASALTAAFAKNGIAAKLLAGDLSLTTGAAGALTTAFKFLGAAAAVAAAGFVGWQIGKLIDDLTGASGAVQKLTEKLMGWNTARETSLAKEDAIRLAIQRGASQYIDYAEAVKFNAGWLQKRLESLKATAAEEKRTVTATASLTAKLDEQNAKVKAADREIGQLSATAKSKLTEAIKSGAFSMKELSEATGLSEMALGRFKDQLRESSRAVKETNKDLEQLARQGVENYKRWQETLKEVDAFSRKSIGGAGSDIRPLKNSAEDAAAFVFAMTKGIPVSQELLKNVHSIGETIASPTFAELKLPPLKIGAQMLQDLKGSLDQIPQILVNAFTGGGNILGAVKAIGSMIGSKLGETIGTALGGPLGAKIGAALGSLAGSAVDLFAKLFSRPGRNAVKDFADEFEGGFDGLRAELNKLGAEGERLWINLTQKVGSKNKEQAESAIKAIRDALAAYKASAEEATEASAEAHAKAMADIADKYAHTLDQIDSERNTLIDRIAGEAPEEFMGLQEIADRARLAELDAQKAAVEEKQRVEEEAAEESFRLAESKADATLDAIQRIFDKGVEIPVRYKLPSGDEIDTRTPPSIPDSTPVPEFAEGTQGWMNFGREGKLARLHGVEAVVRPGDMLPGLREPSVVPIRPVINVNNDLTGSYIDSDHMVDQLTKKVLSGLRKGGANYSDFQNLVNTVGTQGRG